MTSRERHTVLYRPELNCLFNCFFGLTKSITSKLRITDPLREGISQSLQKAHLNCSDYNIFTLECVSLPCMMTSSNGNIFRVTGHLCGEFTGPRWIPRTKASDAELWCFLWWGPNKRLSKQSWGWRFETLSPSLWRHRNGMPIGFTRII